MYLGAGRLENLHVRFAVGAGCNSTAYTTRGDCQPKGMMKGVVPPLIDSK
jgi:hypothetical protein